MELNKQFENKLLMNSGSKGESSMANKKTALASGELTMEDSLENVDNSMKGQDPLA